jgi:hypothetical protein
MNGSRSQDEIDRSWKRVTRGGETREKRTLLLNALSLSGTGPLRNRLAEHSHEGGIIALRESRELAELKLGT